MQLRIENQTVAYWMYDCGWGTSIGDCDLGGFIRGIIGDGGWNRERIPSPSAIKLADLISTYMNKKVEIWDIRKMADGKWWPTRIQ